MNSVIGKTIATIEAGIVIMSDDSQFIWNNKTKQFEEYNIEMIANEIEQLLSSSENESEPKQKKVKKINCQGEKSCRNKLVKGTTFCKKHQVEQIEPSSCQKINQDGKKCKNKIKDSGFCKKHFKETQETQIMEEEDLEDGQIVSDEFVQESDMIDSAISCC